MKGGGEKLDGVTRGYVRTSGRGEPTLTFAGKSGEDRKKVGALSKPCNNTQGSSSEEEDAVEETCRMKREMTYAHPD